MPRRRNVTESALSDAQIALSVAVRGHDEAMVDQVNHVVSATLSELLGRIDNLEHDIRMLDKKLDILIERELHRERPAESGL